MFHSTIKYLLKNQVLFALFIIFIVWFMLQIRDIILSIFFSYIIMAAILPSVNYLRKRGFPKVLAVLLPYLGIILVIFLLFLPLVPFIVDQIKTLVKGLPQYANQSGNIFGININAKEIEQNLNGQLNTISTGALSLTTKVFGGIFTLMSTFIISFYLLLYYDSFKRSISKLFEKKDREAVLITVDRVNDKLGAWLRGQAVLCFFIFFITWIALIALRLPYALPLALLAGILEVVPTLGPILSAIPAVLLALTVSPTMAVLVIFVYVLIQMTENHILVPNIMQKAVGLNPVFVILAILVGSRLMGVTGALLAIPFTSFFIVIYESIVSIQKDNNS